MGKHRSKQRRKPAQLTEASTPTIWKRPRPDVLEESPLLLPSSDSSEKIDVPSASGVSSDPPASPSSENGNNYYVFLSFRGPDTRKGFVDHLYQRLKAVGLRCHTNPVFRDDEDLPFGENIGENLISAIERSKVLIPVISENYAASEWCLRELIHIMKCKESRGQIVLPVLYKVKPYEVRELKGAFGKAYKSCKDKFEEEVKQQGPLALRKAVDLRVFEPEKFADGREGELVNELVEIILREQQHDFRPHLPMNLVAIEDRVAEVMELVDLACPDTRIIGIWGMGGIGKTTLAMNIYNNLFDEFKFRSCLKDIRETIDLKGVEHVQSLLISDILKIHEHLVHDPKTGIRMIQSSCEKKKVLILLDDVDRRDHLDNLIGGCNFESGSRIIITCRDKTLLKSEYTMYELKVMNPKDSLILFSRYAFEGEQPPTGLTDLSSDIVATTGGLPLALMVTGSFLNGVKDPMVWTETLEKLRNASDEIVQGKLRMEDHLKRETCTLMEDHFKRADLAETSTSTILKRPRSDVLEELPVLLPSSDSLEKIDVPSASRANSDPSASSTSVNGNNYCVFLSFRGLDTRNSFVDHLYQRLKDVGLRFHPNFVLRDDKDLPYSREIAAKLISAITQSRVSIPVISEDYAASEWCLRELIHIMKCKESRGQIVLPVLYKVKPKDVRHLGGSFGEAFRIHEHCFDEEVKQQGLAALRKALDLRIFESETFADGCEAELIKELIRVIMGLQQPDILPHLPLNLVGIEDREAEVMELVDIACPETRIIGIWGIGGIGKTTLATIIYNKLFNKFQCCSFLKDIRETTKSKGMEHVQSLLISDLRKYPKSTVRDPERGINMIRLSCEKKKVLFFLDDVDHRDQLDKLIGGCNFGLGSRIIITCRDKALLKSKNKCYELKEMNDHDSILLFSLYAFGAKQPPPELVTLSRDVVATIGGLPLALVVVGSLLNREKDQMVWREMLEKLRNVPDQVVREKLKISYDTLSHAEKQMFLDIACFFIGTDKRIATYFWADLKFFPRTGLQILSNCSLIKIDEENRLRMHNQLRNLGRAIACPADKKPWDCSRLWDKKAMAVLRSKENENIEALCLDKNGSSKFMEQKSFKRLPNLKFLHLSAVDFAGHLEESLCGLRWLKWESCPHSFKATSVHLEKLLVFDLSGGNIHENWEGWGSIKMERLKVLNLSSCSNLKTTPKLSAFKSLEMLILEYCQNLEEIDSSVGDVKSLVSLNLRYCGSLKKLPAELGQLKELEELLIDETDIREIPSWIGSLKKLKMLSAVGCGSLTQIHSSISCLVNLSTLNLTTCKNLQELCSFNALGELRRLYLVGCYRLKQITFSIGKLEKLVELDMSYTRIKLLPESIANLENLKILRISHSEIQKLPSTIGKLESLQELDASGCHKLEGKILGDIGGLSSLRTLHLGKAKISHLPENFRELSSLNHLDLLYCSKLESLPDPPSGLSSLQLTCRSNTLPSLSHLSRLKKLTLHCCMFLESIPQLPSNIHKLCVWKCPKLKTLPNLSNLRSLMELELLQCYGLMHFNGLEALESLTKLDVSTSPELPNLNDFEDLELWTNLDLQSYDGEVDNLLELRGISHLKSLEVLNISARKRIRQLDLSKSEHLKRLIVNNCESLVEIRCHDKIESLEHFDRNGCKSLTILPDFLAYDRS